MTLKIDVRIRQTAEVGFYQSICGKPDSGIEMECMKV